MGQKSRSVDVAMDGSGAAASRFADYTTTASAAKETKAEEDIPDWKRRMLERQKKDQEKKEEEEQKARNFGFIPGTTLHSSYVNKSYDSDSRLTTWGSASNLRSSNSYTNLTNTAEEDTSRNSYRNSTPTSSSWSRASVEKKPEPELSPYEKYLQRKREQDRKEEEEQEEGRRETGRRKEAGKGKIKTTRGREEERRR